MKFKFTVTPVSTKKIKALPRDWTLEDYRAIIDLAGMESREVSDAEAEEMTLMVLADQVKSDAATMVLQYLMGDAMTEGQIQNASHEMEEEKLWQEYADLKLHRAFFSANSLLYKAFNGGFPRPEALEITINIQPHGKEGMNTLKNLDEALLLRILAAGMDEHALLHRLLEDQLKGTLFPEAEHIIWQKSSQLTGDELSVTLLSSESWFDDFTASTAYECQAWEDKEEEDED